MPELIIGDDTPALHADGFPYSKGLIPRNYETHPQGCYAAAPAFDMPLIPRDEWVERIKDMEATKSRLSDVRRRSGPNGGHIPALDQDGIGYCWAHSPTMAVMLLRALMGEPYVRLSAFFIGCIIKDYKDEGGWGALALDFVQQNGIPSVQFWPEKTMKRSNDTPECRANAKLHLVTESWVDLSASVYDRNLTEDQAMTLLLTRCPVVADFNWWSHSVCLLDPTLNVKPTEALPDLGSLDLNDPKDAKVFGDTFGKRGLNSWTDQYGDLGEFVLTGTKAHLDGGCAPRVTSPANA